MNYARIPLPRKIEVGSSGFKHFTLAVSALPVAFCSMKFRKVTTTAGSVSPIPNIQMAGLRGRSLCMTSTGIHTDIEVEQHNRLQYNDNSNARNCEFSEMIMDTTDT